MVVLVALWVPGIWQGAYRTDTGGYAAIALHAWRDGSLFPLWAGDQPYFNKPPLTFWIHGLILHAFGPELWAARLGSLLAAMILVVATGAAGRALAGPRVGFGAALVLALTVDVFRATRSISLDLWLAAWLSVAVWLVALGVRRGRAGLIVCAGVPIALALLTKPFTGLIALPLLGLWLLFERPRAILPLLGAGILAVALAAPWHVAMSLRFPGVFWAEYLGRQVLDRATGANAEPAAWWYYVKELSARHWPWLIAVVGAIACAPRTLFPTTGDAPARGRRPRAASALRLSLLWTGAWLVGLSIFADKAARYALPMVPALSLLAALWIARDAPAWARRLWRPLARWSAPALVAIALALCLINPKIHGGQSPHWAALEEFLRERPGEPVFIAPRLTWAAANVYLMTGRWPGTARDAQAIERAEPGTDPPVGSLLLVRTDTGAAPRSVDPPVWSFGPLVVVRTAAPWDGAYPPPRPAGAP